MQQTRNCSVFCMTQCASAFYLSILGTYEQLGCVLPKVQTCFTCLPWGYMSNCTVFCMTQCRVADVLYLSALGTLRCAQQQEPSNNSHCVEAQGALHQLDGCRGPEAGIVTHHHLLHFYQAACNTIWALAACQGSVLRTQELLSHSH